LYRDAISHFCLSKTHKKNTKDKSNKIYSKLLSLKVSPGIHAAPDIVFMRKQWQKPEACEISWKTMANQEHEARTTFI
jgi:hypothetical protein